MAAHRSIGMIASAALALCALIPAAQAQPATSPGSGMGPGMMMGPGAMHRGMMGRMCGPRAAGFTQWRIERVERAVKPTEAQKAKFDELKAAAAKSAELMRSACPAETPKTVTGRMEAMEKRMDVMLQAVKTMRPALDAFYATLTDEQKAELDSRGGRGRRWHGRW